LIVEAAKITRAQPVNLRVTSHLHTSNGLQPAKVRELLVNICIASLQFYKAPVRSSEEW
jgi:hypothetical protein